MYISTLATERLTLKAGSKSCGLGWIRERTSNLHLFRIRQWHLFGWMERIPGGPPGKITGLENNRPPTLVCSWTAQVPTGRLAFAGMGGGKALRFAGTGADDARVGRGGAAGDGGDLGLEHT